MNTNTDSNSPNTNAVAPGSARTLLTEGRRAQYSEFHKTLRRLRRNPSVVAGAFILTSLILLAIFAPLIAPYDPTDPSPRERILAPSRDHLFGTDELGRDVFSAVLHGARISLRVGLISMGIGATIGTLVGLLAGFYGKWTDTILMRLIDILLAFPGILLAITFVAMLGPGLNNVMIAVGIANIPRFARVVRGSVLGVKNLTYIEAAESIGTPGRLIMFKHILPNILSPIIVMATLGIASAILSAAGLSFLGMGAQPPTPEWGSMLSNARNYLREAWWWATFPGLAIMLTVLGMNLLGDGLRDTFDPRLRSR